jgi:glycosyltransferase involved in cell wall biosynthesis
MRVLAIYHDSFWPPFGGGSTRLFWVIKNFLERGHQVTIVSPFFNKKGLTQNLPNIEIVDLGKHSRFDKRKLFSYLQVMLKIFYFGLIIKKNQFDLIYATHTVSAIPAIIIAKIKKIPIIYDLDDISLALLSEKYGEKIGLYTEIFLTKNSTQVITMCKSLKNEMVKYGLKNIIVVLHGANINIFKPNKCIKQNIIIYSGGIEKHDGVDLIPTAAKIVIDKYNNYKFFIVGKGSALDKIKNDVKKLSLKEHFVFIDWMPQQKLPSLLNKSRFGLITHYKNLACNVAYPQKGLEYMAIGLPMVTSNLAGLIEQIGDNQRGICFKAGDATDLAKKIIFLIENPKTSDKMGKNGLKYVTQNCDININSLKIVKICENTLFKFHQKNNL